MSDLAAFCRVVIRDPSDTTTRLVLADWCDDNGREDLAGLLRGPGVWVLAGAAWAAGADEGFEAEKGRRYLLWWAGYGTTDGRRAAVVGPVKRTFPAAWQVRCHCLNQGPVIVYTDGAWHCPRCPTRAPSRPRPPVYLPPSPGPTPPPVSRQWPVPVPPKTATPFAGTERSFSAEWGGCLVAAVVITVISLSHWIVAAFR